MVEGNQSNANSSGEPEQVDVRKAGSKARKLLRAGANAGALTGIVLTLGGEPVAAQPTATIDQYGRPNIHFVSNNPESRVQEYFELIARGEITPSYRSDFLVLPAGTVLQRTPGNINLGLPKSYKIDTNPFVVPEGKVVVFQYAGKLDNGEEVVYASPKSEGDLTSEGTGIYSQALFYGFDSPGEEWYSVKGKNGTNDSVVLDSNGQPALPAPSSDVAKYQVMNQDELTDFLRQKNLERENPPITGP